MGIWFHKTNKAFRDAEWVRFDTLQAVEAAGRQVRRDTFALRLVVIMTLTSNLIRLSLLLRRKTLTLPSRKTAMAGMSFSVKPCAATTGRDFGMITTVVWLHNGYGPFKTFQGSREEAPAAICR